MDGETSGESCSVAARERRTQARYSVDEDSVLLIMSHGVPALGRMENLSLSGCRVRTRERISARVGSRIEISFKVKGAAFRFSGILVWTIGRNFAGIHFVDMIARCKAELGVIIGEMEAASAARAEAVNLAVASERTEADADPCRIATRGEVQQAIATGSGRSSRAANPKLETSSEGVPSDRRIHTRHTVDTYAVIFLINVGSALRGRILDLSESGCRIRTEERFPVGIFTRVETEFRLEGLPFRLGGVIQAIHNRNTVGIRFLDLSERKRQQVAELIGEIEQVHAAQTMAEAEPAEKPAAPAAS